MGVRWEAKVEGDDIKVSTKGASKYHWQKPVSHEGEWQWGQEEWIWL